MTIKKRIILGILLLTLVSATLVLFLFKSNNTYLLYPKEYKFLNDNIDGELPTFGMKLSDYKDNYPENRIDYESGVAWAVNEDRSLAYKFSRREDGVEQINGLWVGTKDCSIFDIKIGDEFSDAKQLLIDEGFKFSSGTIFSKDRIVVGLSMSTTHKVLRMVVTIQEIQTLEPAKYDYE